MTPPIVIPVTSAVNSGGAKDAFFAPSRLRTVRFTSSRSGASTTQAASAGGSSRLATTMQFAESSSATS